MTSDEWKSFWFLVSRSRNPEPAARNLKPETILPLQPETRNLEPETTTLPLQPFNPLPPLFPPRNSLDFSLSFRILTAQNKSFDS
jgi:hypothetical protein